MTCVHRFRDTQVGLSFGVWFYEMTVEKEHPLLGVVCLAGEVTRQKRFAVRRDACNVLQTY